MMRTPIKTVLPEAKHEAFRDELIAVVRKHGSELKAEEILALLAHLVGQVIAMQDQRVMSADMAIDLVSHNIEAGNADAVKTLLSPVAGHG